MSDPFVGEIQIFGFPFAPRNWAFAGGQTLPIRQNTTLYTLYGTQFGGDGSTTFQLPNLAARAPCGAGQSPGNSRRQVGQTFGSNSIALQSTQMPMHTHTLIDYQPGQLSQLTGIPVAAAALGYDANETVTPFADPAGAATMDPSALGAVGNGSPHENRQPFLGLNYSVALLGIYPMYD